jgi:hypothetical protein
MSLIQLEESKILNTKVKLILSIVSNLEEHEGFVHGCSYMGNKLLVLLGESSTT